MTKMSYPPTHIKTDDGVVNILQLTDPHLYLDPTTEVAGINNQHCFDTCLTQALNEDKRCDLILLTGDLVNEVKTEIYDRLFEQLSQTGIPFAWIAGNHDVTDELDTHLPFTQRRFEAHQPDERLLSQHCISVNDWNILLIDSSVAGQIYGEIDTKSLDWMRQKIQNCHNPVIITMHHHVLPMNSKWIDEHIIKNADDFWEVAEQYQNIKAVVSGHVHQYSDSNQAGINVYTTPSTCYQFKKNHDEFLIDTDANPGYRWLTLYPEGELQTTVMRINR